MVVVWSWSLSGPVTPAPLGMMPFSKLNPKLNRKKKDFTFSPNKETGSPLGRASVRQNKPFLDTNPGSSEFFLLSCSLANQVHKPEPWLPVSLRAAHHDDKKPQSCEAAKQRDTDCSGHGAEVVSLPNSWNYDISDSHFVFLFSR